MGSLANQYISQSYTSLIHLGSDRTISSSYTDLQDGLGNTLNISVNAQGDISASGNIFAANLSAITYDTGSLLTTASANLNTITFTKGNGSTFNVTVNTGSAGGSTDISSLNAFTASVAGTNAFTASVAGTNTFTASIAGTNVFTQSAAVSIAALNAATSSYVTSAITASSLVTASFAAQTLTFTKGDGTTFGVVIPDVSGSTINTGSFATTGSNAFVGNQTITGSVTISGSATTDLTVVGQIFVSSSAATGTTTPRITVSGSAGRTVINRNSITTFDTTDNGGMFPSTIYTQDSTTADEIGFTVDPSVFSISGWSNGPAIYVQNPTNTFPAVIGFQNKANYTDGRVAVLTPLSASAGFTASLQNGYAWVGNSLGQNTQVPTSSFAGAVPAGVATTGSNNFVGDQTISGSLIVSGSATNDVEVYGNIRVYTDTVNTFDGANVFGNIYVGGGNIGLNENYSIVWTNGPRIDTSATNMLITASVFDISGSFVANGNKQFNIGTFQSDVTQSGSANVSQSMNFEVTDISEGVTIASNSRITLANSGTYNIQFSVQVDRVSGSGTDTVHIWLKKNGTNVDKSAGAITISGAASAAKTIAAWNYVVNAAANDYYELVWEATDTNVQLINQPASGNIPSTPSIILTVTQVR